MSKFELSNRSKSIIDSIKDEDLKLVFHTAITVTPIDFGVPYTGGLRNWVMQNDLYTRGKTPVDGIDRISNHQYGVALDYYAYINGRVSYNKIHMAMVGSCILTVGNALRADGKIKRELRWGATFGRKGRTFQGYDFPHIEAVYTDAELQQMESV